MESLQTHARAPNQGREEPGPEAGAPRAGQMAFAGKLGPAVPAADCHRQEEAEARAAGDQSQYGLESSALDSALFPASLRAQDCASL